MIEGSDNGGMVYNQSHNGHLVFVLLGGEVETWWNDGGVGRWRRALPGALSVGGPGRAPNRSWINPRHYAFATVQPEYLRSVVSGEALRRLTEMSTHYCLHEYYPRAAEGVELVKALNRLMYEAASEVGLHVEELSLGLVRWLEGVAGCPPQWTRWTDSIACNFGGWPSRWMRAWTIRCRCVSSPTLRA